MSELVPLSQKPWALLGGVADGYFSHRDEPVIYGKKEEVQLRKVNLGDVLGLLDEVQAGDFEREVRMYVGELHPLLTSISTPRFIVQENVPYGVPRLYFQIEGRLEGNPGVATIVFDPDVDDPMDLVTYESDYGDPEEVGRHEGVTTVCLEEVYEQYPEAVRSKLEKLIVHAFLRGAPDVAKLIKFSGSEAVTGVFSGQTKEGERYIVVQHPALVDGVSAILRAVITFGKDEMDMPIEISYETKFI